MTLQKEDTTRLIETITELFGGTVDIIDPDEDFQPDDPKPAISLHDAFQEWGQVGSTLCIQEVFALLNVGWGQLGSTLIIEEITALLDAGAPINMRNDQGETVLFYAVDRYWGDEALKAILFLIERGANVNLGDRGGRAPLHVAARIGSRVLISALLDKGADIDARDGLGRTPLFYAKMDWPSKAMKYLLERGANWRVRDKYGVSPLHRAAGLHALESMDDFLARGLDPDTRDDQGETPLHYAVRNEEYFHIGLELRLDAIRLLLEYGANIHARNDAGETPLDVAFRDGEKEIIAVSWGWR